MNDPKLDLEPGKQEVQPMVKCDNCGLTHPPRRLVFLDTRLETSSYSQVECVLKQRQVMHALLKDIGYAQLCRTCTELVVVTTSHLRTRKFTPDGEPHVCKKESI